MTISSTVRKAGPFDGTGSQTEFPFEFKVFSESDLYVVHFNEVTGVETVLDLDTDYTVTLNEDQDSDPGGTVTLDSALATNYTLTITSSIANLQPTDLTNRGGFYPTVINDALDRACIQIQQLQDSTDRTLKTAVSVPDGIDNTLPMPAANMVIGWDNTGAALKNWNVGDLVTSVAYGSAKAFIDTGDGSTVDFYLEDDPASINNLDVSVGGVCQVPGDDYTWVSGTKVTFTVAPPDGETILIRYMQALPQATVDATNVPYKASGTGSVQRTAASKFAETVSVKDFGAVGDGTTPDHAAIQNALDSLGGNSGVVHFPTGSYKLGAAITIPSNACLVSYTKATIVCNGYGFSIDGANVTLDGLVFDQDHDGARYPTTIGIGNDSEQITIKNCKFYGSSFYCISMGGSRHRVIDNEFTDTVSQVMLSINNAHYTLVSGNNFHDIGLCYVVLISNSQHTMVCNNSFNTILNNPILCNTGCYNATITGNVLAGTGDSGILTANDWSGNVPAFITISNNVVTGSPDTGIGCIVGYNITISGNTLLNNGRSGVNGYNSQIYVGAAYQVSVVGNTLNNTSYNPSAIYGIYAICSEDGSDKRQVTRLMVTGNTYSGFADGNNIFFPIGSGGTAWQPAKAQVYEGTTRFYPANINFDAWASTLPDNVSGLLTWAFTASGATCSKETSAVIYGNSAKIVGGVNAGILTATLAALNMFQRPCIAEVTVYAKCATASDVGYIGFTASIAGSSPAPKQEVTFGGTNESTTWTPYTVRMVIGLVTGAPVVYMSANAGSTIYFDEVIVKITEYNN